MEKFLSSNSPKGGAFGKTLGAGVSAPLHSDMPVTSCAIWTALTDVYVQIDGIATSDIGSGLIPANTLFPLPYENLNQINAISATGGNVWVFYRKSE